MQVDLFHQGKGDEDDHKVVHERLLNLAVPADPEGKGLKLEDCLEEYFNNKVDVLRDSLEEKEKKALERPALDSKNSIRVVTEEDEDTPTASSGNVDHSVVQPKWTIEDTIVQSPLDMPSASSSKTFDAPPVSPPVSRNRSTSIIQRIVVDGEEETSEAIGDGFVQRARRTGSTIVKAVTIPAWQFFRLIRELSGQLCKS